VGSGADCGCCRCHGGYGRSVCSPSAGGLTSSPGGLGRQTIAVACGEGWRRRIWRELG
jgi:hypothetical protein